MKLPFEELHMGDPTHVEWVKQQRDPALWHAAAIATLVYIGDPHKFLLWLIDQPEMDRSTAAYIFLGRDGSRYLQGQTEFLGEGLSGRGLLEVHEALCRRGATVGFTNDTLGLAEGFEAERQKCLDLVNRRAVADGIMVPTAIIGAPFPAGQGSPYFIEDGAILDYNPGPFV